MAFDFQKNYLIEELKKLSPEKVLVQLPEGVKTKAIEIKELIEKLGIEVIFSGETAWGGCCLAIDEAKKFEADLIVHFGHAEYVKTDTPVIYIEIQDKLDFTNILKKSLGALEKYRTIGLSYSVQHKVDSEEIKEFYEKEGKRVLFSKKRGHVAYEGQIIGCEYAGLKEIQNEVDAFVIIGNRFHGLGAGMSLKKPVYLIDVYNDGISNMTNNVEKLILQRFRSIEKAKEAKNVGVVVESKIGQNFGSAKVVIEKLKVAGKNPILISMSEISKEKIENFYNIDAFVELACPRIAIDDYAVYSKPMLTYREMLVMIGELSWEKFLDGGVL